MISFYAWSNQVTASRYLLSPKSHCPGSFAALWSFRDRQSPGWRFLRTSRILHPMAWQFEYSIECNVPREFAWKYWTNIENWNDPPARFQLEGPFAAGAKLTTFLPGQTLHSVIRDVQPECEATIEMQLPDALLSFRWTFEKLADDRTGITQRLALSGPNADSFVAQIRIMETSVPEGMKKIAAAINQAHRSAE